MKVKDLKQALEKFDDDAIVCIDAMEDCVASVSKQYTLANGKKFAYIADDLEYVESVFSVPLNQCVVGYEELKEALYGSYLTEEELKNLDMIEKALVRNGEIVWQLNARGNSYIFSDQVEDDNTITGWKTEHVPFPSQSHYFYVDERFGKPVYCAYAWYGAKESYVDEFASLNDCLDWLVSEEDLQLDSVKNELINTWTKALLERTNKPSLEALSSKELQDEIEGVRGTISNERLWAHADPIHEENIANLVEYLNLLEECASCNCKTSLCVQVRSAAKQAAEPGADAPKKPFER